ncbi:unnamed protein product, partial [Prorocentrum cordatum]
WEQQHRTDNVWGNRSRYTSSDSAFSHNLDSEVAVLRGQFSATVLLDLTKAFDMVRPSQLFREGCLLGYPPRMLYMLLKMYAQPRSLKGYGTFSDMVQVDQGEDFDLLRVAPADMKVFLEESIKRWQVQRLAYHLPVQ